MPRQSRPVPALMHATELPRAFHRAGWVYEEKYDGWRMVAEKVDSQVSFTGRNGLDHTRRFPELAKAVADLDAPSIVLDGEVAIFDRQLLSRFEWLRTRPKHEVMTPPMYMVFDLLALGVGGPHLHATSIEQLAERGGLHVPKCRTPGCPNEASEDAAYCDGCLQSRQPPSPRVQPPPVKRPYVQQGTSRVPPERVMRPGRRPGGSGQKSR